MRREGRPRPSELITGEERSVLFQAMADYTPEELPVGGPLSTCPLVAELVRMAAGVVMTERGVGEWLRQHGFTSQRPARRSYHQQQDKVTAWLQEEYPAIAGRTQGEKAVVAWADQCGLRPETSPPGCSWATAGQTPLVKVGCRRFGVNSMSAVASCGAVWFSVFTGKFIAKVVTTFLGWLARQAGRKVHLIAGRHPVHCGKAVRIWLKANTGRIELRLMPGYGPEFNPDELLNADLEYHVPATCAASADDLARGWATQRFRHSMWGRDPRVGEWIGTLYSGWKGTLFYVLACVKAILGEVSPVFRNQCWRHVAGTPARALEEGCYFPCGPAWDAQGAARSRRLGFGRLSAATPSAEGASRESGHGCLPWPLSVHCRAPSHEPRMTKP